MEITGAIMVGGESRKGNETFEALNPTTGESLAPRCATVILTGSRGASTA